ncbi:hypothetical protein HK104_003123 [Borealophlyctis nickersoniae]|nr:hypothetical protein HK104_003123 [Borealophlyctis nickersoniae]
MLETVQIPVESGDGAPDVPGDRTSVNGTDGDDDEQSRASTSANPTPEQSFEEEVFQDAPIAPQTPTATRKSTRTSKPPREWWKANQANIAHSDEPQTYASAVGCRAPVSHVDDGS